MKYLFLIFVLFPFTSIFSQELVPLKKQDKYAFFLNEQRVTDFRYDAVSAWHEMGYVVAANGAQGMVNQQGEEAIPIQYDYLSFGGQNVIIAGQNGVAGVLDAQGNELLPFIYERVDQFSASGTAVVKKNGQWGVLRNGQLNHDISKVVFKHPDTYPLFAGANRKRDNEQEKQQRSANKLLEFIIGEYVSSPKVIKNRIGGSATIAFIITPEGKVSNPWIEGTDSNEFAKILIEVVKQMPVWATPPMANGTPVAMEYKIPVELNMK
jgi:hypothetical protein